MHDLNVTGVICNRPCTNVSQVMHNLKCYPEVQMHRYWPGMLETAIRITSGSTLWIRVFVSFPWMHNPHAQIFVYQLPYDCKEQENLHHVCLSWGHLYLACCDHLLVRCCMVPQCAWKGTQMGRLYFCSRWEICVVHTFSATICWFPCIIGSWLALSLKLYSSKVSIHTVSH